MASTENANCTYEAGSHTPYLGTVQDRPGTDHRSSPDIDEPARSRISMTEGLRHEIDEPHHSLREAVKIFCVLFSTHSRAGESDA